MKQSDVVQAFRPAMDVKVRTTFNMVQGFGLAICVALLPAALLGKSAPVVDTKIDAVFAKYSSSTPGCAVGVATNGTPVLAKGFGMADLEHNVAIGPDTIFEGGSVSKQFTAAAVMLLARDGKLSLDDQVRKYVPELPDYPPSPVDTPAGSGEASPKTPVDTPAGSGEASPKTPVDTPAGSGEASPKTPSHTPAGSGEPSPKTLSDTSVGHGLTIRHMLTHTSGLRDWGNIESIAGWPRTTRAYTHAHVLEIVGRQRALNFTPGTRWSYSNTGFNLAAIIVERVSGQTFQDFTHSRVFQPIGMTHTSWRDDYTRVVKGRAIAYSERSGSDGFHTDMPFENVFGNGGLLTTVGDLLKWNEHYDAPAEGDASITAEQQKAGHFTDGRVHGYGLGLFVGTHKGLREIYHSGSTAGYQAFLTRFPDQKVSVAVLCNVATAQATEYAHSVADAYLGDRVKTTEVKATYTLASGEMDRFVGQWKSDVTELPITIARDADGLFVGRNARLLAQSPTRLITGDGGQLELDAHGVRLTDAYGTVQKFSRVQPAVYTDAQLLQLAGIYVSDEAETTLTAAVENHALVLKRRPDTTIALTPLYPGAFSADHGLGTVIFRHDASGRSSELSVIQDRVWDLRFRKLEGKSQK
jgi:CubicO group peptidase (beta-lactamase class C family)